MDEMTAAEFRALPGKPKPKKRRRKQRTIQQTYADAPICGCPPDYDKGWRLYHAMLVGVRNFREHSEAHDDEAKSQASHSA